MCQKGCTDQSSATPKSAGVAPSKPSARFKAVVRRVIAQQRKDKAMSKGSIIGLRALALSELLQVVEEDGIQFMKAQAEDTMAARGGKDAAWSCGDCTFSNPSMHLACGACGTERVLEKNDSEPLEWTADEEIEAASQNGLSQYHRWKMLARSVSDDGGAAAGAGGPRNDDKPKIGECMICMEEDVELWSSCIADEPYGLFHAHGMRMNPNRGGAGHKFCRECLQAHVKIRLGEGKMPDCAMHGCDKAMTDGTIDAVCGGEMLEHKNKIKRTVEERRDPRSRWCPKCNAHTRCAADGGVEDLKDLNFSSFGDQFGGAPKAEPKAGRWHANRVTCPNAKECGYQFCKCCNGKHHPWRPCVGDAARMRLVMWSWFHNAKPCPKCKTMIQKNNGCPHMTCGNCSYYFCWGCKRGLNQSAAIGGKACPGGLLCNELTHHWIWGPNAPVRFVTKSVGYPTLFAIATTAALGIALPFYTVTGIHKSLKRRQQRRRMRAQQRKNRQARSRASVAFRQSVQERDRNYMRNLNLPGVSMSSLPSLSGLPTDIERGEAHRIIEENRWALANPAQAAAMAAGKILQDELVQAAADVAAAQVASNAEALQKFEQAIMHDGLALANERKNSVEKREALATLEGLYGKESTQYEKAREAADEAAATAKDRKRQFRLAAASRVIDRAASAEIMGGLDLAIANAARAVSIEISV